MASPITDTTQGICPQGEVKKPESGFAKKKRNRNRRKTTDANHPAVQYQWQTSREAVQATDTSKYYDIKNGTHIEPSKKDLTNTSWLDDLDTTSQTQPEPVPAPRNGKKKLNQAERRKLAAELTIQIDTRPLSVVPKPKQKQFHNKTATEASKSEEIPKLLVSQVQSPPKISYAAISRKSENEPPETSHKIVSTFKTPLQPYTTQADVQKWRPHINLLKASKPRDTPLTEFTIFPNLAAELRLKIWYWACHQDRLIELSWHQGNPYPPGTHFHSSYDDDESIFEMHQRIRVCKLPCSPPAILQINHEARVEALKHYKLTNFDTHSYNSPTSIYFNPSSDILFFGEHTCISTLIQFLRQSHTISRIAIISSNKIYLCCDWDTDGSPYSDVFGGSIPGGCTAIQALHGIDPELATNTGFPGCKGLREVFWIVPTAYKSFAAGEVNADTILRKTITDGITEGQRKCKAQIIDSMKEVDDEGLKLVGPNDWSGSNKPIFRFRTLAPRGVGNRYHDAMLLNLRHVRKLGMTDTNPGRFVSELEANTGCEITVCGRAAPGERETEVGFYGTVKEIGVAREGIEEKVRAFGDLGRGFQRGHWDRKRGKGRWRAQE